MRGRLAVRLPKPPSLVNFLSLPRTDHPTVWSHRSGLKVCSSPAAISRYYGYVIPERLKRCPETPDAVASAIARCPDMRRRPDPHLLSGKNSAQGDRGRLPEDNV